MNPGEYVGEDGRTYRWERLGEHWTITVTKKTAWDAGGLRINDWPKAKAALDALIESEQEEWVEWEGLHYSFRATPDGSRVQCAAKDAWKETREWGGAGYDDEAAFRAGLKTGQEQARELVEATLSCPENTISPNNWEDALRWFKSHYIPWRDRCVALAKAVKV